MNLLLILLASLLSCAGQLCQKQAAHCGGHRLFGWLVLGLLLLALDGDAAVAGGAAAPCRSAWPTRC